MKTKEFIRHVEELGFKVTRFSFFSGKKDYLVYQEGGCSSVAHVSKNYSYSFDTNRPDFDKLSSETQSKLFNLLAEYASTPLEERQEEKKYYIRMKNLDDNCNYLNYNTYDEFWCFNNHWKTTDCKVYFTLAELPNWAKEMLEQGHLVKEEVENE